MPSRTPIPRLTPTGNGFGGFTANRSIPYPGGRVTVSDVQDAYDSMMFDGVRSSPTPTPFNPTPTPTPQPTPTFEGDPTGAGLVGHEIRDFYNTTYDRRFWGHDPRGTPDPGGETGVNPGVDYIYTGPGGRPPGIITDVNEDWTGTPKDPTVELYTGAPGSGGVPVWWDTSNRGTNTFGPQPWWMNFNPNIGVNLNHDFSGPGFGDNYDPGRIVGGPKPSLGPGEAWVDLGDYTGSNGGVPSPDRGDPGFIDPGTGLGPDPTGSGSTTGRGGSRDNTGGGDPGADLNYLASRLGPGTHWDFTRGGYVQNDYAGGAQFSSTAADLLEMWDQSRPGNPNRQVAPDSGKDRLTGVGGVLDPETGKITVTKRSPTGPAWKGIPQSAGAPTLYAGNPESAAAYNARLMNQPEYKAFMQRMLGTSRAAFQPGVGAPAPRVGSGG